MKVIVFTLGCKVNEVESAKIMSALECAGFEVEDKLGFADAYVLNTCAVTAEAEKKSRQLVARAKKFNPQASVYVCGCASQKNAPAFEEKGVKFVCGTSNRYAVVDQICADFNAPCQSAEQAYPKLTKTRAFVKIGDGCNNFCSYCIIPHLRGRVSSRKADDVVAEIKECNAQEIVLTAINLSAYNDGENDLTELIKKLKFCQKRIRLGSLECRVITRELLTALKDLFDFAPQFHLSLQSGSDTVLKSMNRRYASQEFIEKCALIYEFFPDGAITTDVIVGFPTETDDDFAKSLQMVKTANFSRVHAFAFSPREGTPAHKMKDLAKEIKSARLHTLMSTATDVEKAYISARKGKTYSVILEDFDGQYTGGYTPNYIRVYVMGNHCGQQKNVVLGEPFKDGALGYIDGENTDCVIAE